MKIVNYFIRILKMVKKENLTDIQREVTQNCGTEPPFNNEYWNNKEPE